MMKKFITHWTFSFITLIALTYIGLQDPYIKEILRLKSFDILIQQEPKEVSSDIGIVTIDEKSIEKYGQWPWKRDALAQIIYDLRQAGAGIIMIPILFSEEDRLGGDDALAKALKDNGVIIAQVGTSQIDRNAVDRGVAKIGNPMPYLFEWEGMLGPIQKLGKSADGVGVINTAPEIDGVVRRIPLIMKIERFLGYSGGRRLGQSSPIVEEKTYPTMAVEVIRVATGAPSYQIKSGKGGIIAVRVPGYSIINTDPNARIWLHWNKEFETISASESDFSKFEGRSVIIGTTAEGIGGIIATPVGEKYDYELSASTLQTVLDGKQINRYDISLFVELVASVLLGILVILIARFTPYWFVGMSMVILYGASLVAACYLFNKHLILSDISWIIIVITIVGMHSIFNRFILEFKLKQQIRKQFETYLDPRQVAELQKDPSKLRLGGERKEMSFLFMDIVGFTPISEYYKNKDDPEGLVEVINDYLNRMTKIVLENGGTVDKYMGDCIMAFWNAPLDCENHAEMAVKTSIECAIETDRLKKDFKERGLPDINIGSGVNTGTCIVGNMGSDTRFDYSVIGDAVNLAARLEAATRNYKDKKGNIVPTLYSSYTMKQLKTIKSVEVDKIKVKGKEELVTIYKPL
jgi:adenylate cyclase